jgi:hypothetical protein
VIRRIDWRTAAREALTILAVLGPPVVIVNAVSGDEDSYLWLLPALAIFVAFAAGGWRAARQRPDTPFLHATAASVLALVFIRVVYTVVDLAQGDGFSFPLGFVLLGQVAISVALVSAYLSWRRPARIR